MFLVPNKGITINITKQCYPILGYSFGSCTLGNYKNKVQIINNQVHV